MSQFIIGGGKRLEGEIDIKAAKNSVLPIIACSILSKEDIVIRNVPDILDIKNMLEIMKSLGAKVEFKHNSLCINCKHATPKLITPQLSSALRSSIFMLGPILSRYNYVELGLPGGCAIGQRPIDIHLDGLKKMDVHIQHFEDSIKCDGSNMQGCCIRLKFPSVGATENLMMAAVLTKGTTTLHNVAIEPEIIDLANFINTIGGRVLGAGTSTIVIEGVTAVTGGTFQPSGDRIAAPTYLAAAAITQGDIVVKGILPTLIKPSIDIFEKMGCYVTHSMHEIRLKCKNTMQCIKKVETGPHPQFPTDMQAQMVALLSVANGSSSVVENIFESRYRYVLEMHKMGARIKVDNNTAHIEGIRMLHGASVRAEDLRGGAALVLSALGAQGVSTVRDVHHIDRGYESMEKVLCTLGADIKRVSV